MSFGFSLFVLFDVIGVVIDAFWLSSRKLSPRIWHIRTETSAIFLGHPVLEELESYRTNWEFVLSTIQGMLGFLQSPACKTQINNSFLGIISQKSAYQIWYDTPLLTCTWHGSQWSPWNNSVSESKLNVFNEFWDIVTGLTKKYVHIVTFAWLSF